MLPIKLTLPTDFLKEEDRAGYLVTADMKKVWAVELDLLNELLSVCRSNDLSCYVDAGTLLGAVRHHGFIPWDDDIDVVMFRDDYDRLCNIAEKGAFKSPYHFQTYKTEEMYYLCHAQLRNSYTTAISKSQLNAILPYCMGIYIDIFVLDSVEENFVKRMYQISKAKLWRTAIQSHYVNGEGLSWKRRVFQVILKLYEACGLKFNTSMDAYNDFLRKTPEEKSELVAEFGWEPKPHILQKHLYKSTLDFDFECIKVPVPEEYDVILRKRYGNYMKPIQSGGIHGEMLFDADRPYTDYIYEKKFRPIYEMESPPNRDTF